MIGIICALKIELDGLIEKMYEVNTVQKANMTFFSGKIFSKDVVATQCGVGKVNAAICAQIMIDLFYPTQIINSGIAGALDEQTEIGDVIICSDVVQHDMNTTAIGDPPGLLCLNDDNKIIEIEADHNIAKKLETSCRSVNGINYKYGRIATGDIFVSAKEMRKKINATFGATACEMEGGAIAQTCFRNEIPFGIIRAISDNMNKNKGVDFLKFCKTAAQNSIDIMLEYLKL